MSDELHQLIRRKLPRFAPKTIFDVGANVGVTATCFLTEYPHSRIYAFEPVPVAFKALKAIADNEERLLAFPFALSSTSGPIHMHLTSDTKLSRVVDGDYDAATVVEAITGDNFCADQGVGEIDFLKVDTEGHDLDVLVGFTRLLVEQNIGMVEVEAGVLSATEAHVPLQELVRFMTPQKYHLFWIYEQTHDLYFTGRPVLRRVNAVFVSERVVYQNTIQPFYTRRWERS